LTAILIEGAISYCWLFKFREAIITPSRAF
jgi:hypothetical protein